MDYNAAVSWVATTAESHTYGKHASWGLYTENQSDALSITIALGGPGPCMHEKRNNEYPHYHPSGMLLFNEYKHFHVWYGSVYVG